MHIHLKRNKTKRRKRKTREEYKKKLFFFLFPAIYWITFWYSLTERVCTLCTYTHIEHTSSTLTRIDLHNFNIWSKPRVRLVFRCIFFVTATATALYTPGHTIPSTSSVYTNTWMLFYEWVGSMSWRCWFTVLAWLVASRFRFVRFDLCVRCSGRWYYFILFSFSFFPFCAQSTASL